MLRVACVTLVMLCFATGVASARTRGFQSPPDGIVPTNVTLAQVFARNAKATGVEPLGTRFEVWSFAVGGETGTETYSQRGEDYVEWVSWGPFRTGAGRLKDQAWDQNENGLTVLHHDTGRPAQISREALADAQVDESSHDVTLLGEVSDPIPAYVVEVHPKNGRLQWFYYGKESGLIERIESSVVDRIVTRTYDTFKKTNGFAEAWHVHSSDGRAANDEDYTLKTFLFGAIFSDSTFAIPTNRRILDEIPTGVAQTFLPARFVDDAVIVRVMIGGRGLDFQLDSGSSGIVMDSNVVRELGIKTFAKTRGATAGEYDKSEGLVPEMKIGSITMHDVHVSSLPFNYEADLGTKVVGLLGFDFIADMTIHIDYANQRLEAIDPATFKPPSGADVYDVPIVLDDLVPYVSAGVSGTFGKHFIFDTGAYKTTLFSTFVHRFPNGISSTEYGKELRMAYPEVTADGVGGEISMRPADVTKFQFGPGTFDHWVLFETQSARSFEGEDDDGLIGADFARYFDVYFDYWHSMIYLKQNRTFQKDFKPHTETTPPPR